MKVTPYPRTPASRDRRHSSARCSCRVVPPIRDARFVDLILAVFMCHSARRQERVWRAQRPGAKIEAIATSASGRPHVPHLNPRKYPRIAGYSSETGKHRFASDCVVVGAAWIEPVSEVP
jgi:hypothetical protein